MYKKICFLVIFYNGTDKQPEQQVLRLSDAYEKKTDVPELERLIQSASHGT